VGERPIRRRRYAWAALAVLAATAVVVSLFALRAGAGRPPLERARLLVADDADFDTGLAAGETLAKVAQNLERAVDACRREDRGVSCQALSAALGYAQVLASRVLVCAAPGRHDARTRMAAYLEQAAAVGPDAQRVPGPPRLPSCAD
jgi:hypothetical protein